MQFEQTAQQLDWVVNLPQPFNPWTSPPSPPSPNDLEKWAQDLRDTITSCLEKSTPKLVVDPIRSKPWWSKELTQLRVNLHKQHRNHQKQQTNLSERTWKNARNHYFTTIRDSKQKHWLLFLEGAKDKQVFRAKDYVLGSKETLIPILDYENQEAHTFEEKCNAFLGTIYPTYTPTRTEPPEPGPGSGPRKNPIAPKPKRLASLANKVKGAIEEKDWPALTETELKNALFSTKNDSAQAKTK